MGQIGSFVSLCLMGVASLICVSCSGQRPVPAAVERNANAGDVDAMYEMFVLLQERGETLVSANWLRKAAQEGKNEARLTYYELSASQFKGYDPILARGFLVIAASSGYVDACAVLIEDFPKLREVPGAPAAMAACRDSLARKRP